MAESAEPQSATADHATKDARRGRWAVVAAALLWSTSGAFVKNLELPALSIAAYRALAAGVVLLLLVRATRTRITWAWPMLGMVVAFASMNFSFIASMTLTTAANTILLQYTAPMWMFLASVWWLKEPADRRSLISTIGSMVGIAILLAGQWSGREQQWGIVLGLVSGVMFAGVAVHLRRLREHDPLWLAALNHLSAGGMLAGIGSLAAAGGLGEGIAAPTARQCAVLALFGAGQMALPYVLFGMGLRSISPQEAGVLTLLEPLLNPVWTYLTAGEKPAASTLAGGAVLMSMLALRYVKLPRWTRGMGP